MKNTFLLLFAVLPALWAATAAAERVDVSELQRALAELGYEPGPVNGKWGVETRGALFQFQRDNGFGTSLDVDQDQRQLLGMVTPNAPAPEREIVDLEPDTQTPIVGDIDTAMRLYGHLASHIIFKSFREQAMMNIVTTASNPAVVTLVPPDPLKGYPNIFVLTDARIETSGVHLSAEKLRHKAGAAPDLELFMTPEAQDNAPDRLCDGLSAATTGTDRTHICIVSGQLFFGGTFKLGDNIVSCREGVMTVSNANRDQVFEPGSVCSVNGTPVRLSESGWSEVPT